MSPQAEVAVFRSARGNDAFQPSPIGVPNGALCDKMNVEYRKFVMGPIAETSDMPRSATGDMCPLFEQVSA